MKKKFLYISIVIVLSTGLLYSGWQIMRSSESVLEVDASKPDTQESGMVSPTTDKKEIERYGVVITNSSSGSLRLRYYDINQKKVLDNWQNYYGFWAAVSEEKGAESASELFDYVQSNIESVFKVMGTKESDDCDYYGSGGVCLENIRVLRIEAVAK